MANLRVDNLCGTGGRNAIDGSLYFGGDNDPAGLTIADNTDLELGSETNWTIEFWIKLNHAALSDWDVVMGKGSNDNGGTEYEWFVEVMAANHLVFLSTTAGSAWDFNQQITPVLEIGEWYHVAIVRNGSGSNTLKSYVNGQQYSSHTSQNIYTGNDPFGIGHFAFTNGLNSDVTLSNVRVVKGTSVYTAAFTPPTEKLKPITNTVLLCCQDSDDPTQEATGKTITAYGGFRQDKTEGNLLVNTLDWTGAASSYSTTMPTNWTAGNGAQVQYESGGAGGGAANRKLRLRNDGSNSYIYQTIPTVIGQKYQIDLWYEAQNSSLAVKWLAGTSAAGAQNGSSQWNVGSDGTKYRRTGSFQATSTTTYITFQIISGTNDASVFIDDIQVKAFNPKVPKDVPPVGIDEGVVFNGDTKVNSQGYMYFPTGDTAQRGRGRALFGGGYLTPSGYDGGISYLEMQSSGNTVDFGDLSLDRGIPASTASSTRGIWSGGGIPGGVTDRIDYVTIATTGDAIDFGNNFQARKYFGGCGSQTRGVFGGGDTAPGAAQVDTIDYITIATTGDAEDFGNLTSARQHVGACSSPTRGVWAGGGTPTRVKTIDYITIATTGHAQPFGDLTVTTMSIDGLSSNTRGLFGGGTTPTMVKTIDYITIATKGDAKDFGDLITVNSHYACTSNGIKGIWAGGYDGSGEGYNLIEYVNIASTGNAKDWGDTYRNRKYHAGCSDSHGGIS